MNKVTRILLAIGLILAVATPALAELKLNGYYRLMMYGAEIRNFGGANSIVEGGGANTADVNDEKGDTRQLVDQRLRLMLTNNFNDNVSLVYFGEVDTVWGEQSKGAIGGGGQLGADGVNFETKNVYLDIKDGGFASRLGIQTLADAYQGVVFFDDMAAVKASYKVGGTTLTGAYSKWDEDSNRSDWDDRDFWIADVNQKIGDALSVGASVYFEQDNDSNNADTQTTERLFYGVNADAKFGIMNISGFAVLEDGEIDNDGASDWDTFSYIASVKVAAKIANGDVGVRAIYIPNADDDTDDERWRTPVGRYDFASENLMQMLTDKFVCNYGKERYAMEDAGEEGYGLIGLVASGNHKLPQDMYVNWGAGYFMADDDTANVRGVETKREGDSIGYEVAVRVGKKVYEKVDLSLNASYAGYGDFYDNTARNGDDPDDTYKTYLMVNVPF